MSGHFGVALLALLFGLGSCRGEIRYEATRVAEGSPEDSPMLAVVATKA